MKTALLAALILFSPVLAQAEESGSGGASPVRLSLLGSLSDNESAHSYLYGTLPFDVDRVYGLDVGLLVTNVETIWGLQLSPVAMAETAGVLQVGLAVGYAEEMYGVQFGSLVAVGESIWGLSLAGLGSYYEELEGIQLSGLASIAEDIAGLQYGSLAAGADEVEGGQLSLLGVGAGSVTGFQLGGAVSFADRVTGLQLGGAVAMGSVTGVGLSALRLFSMQDDPSAGIIINGIGFGGDYFEDEYMVTGLQLGAFNIGGGDIKGVQASAINHATFANGLQFGLINYASKLNGLQIGIINICPDAAIPVLPLVNARFDTKEREAREPETYIDIEED